MSAQVYLDWAILVLGVAAIVVWAGVIRGILREHRVHDRDEDFLP